jgi:hypothetical protein
MKIDRSEFLRRLKSYFPNLRSDLNQQQGLLHFEVSEFRKYTNNLVREGNKDKVKSCFKIAEQGYLHGNAKMKNAIDVSYVEDLEFYGKAWAWQLLPNVLKDLYVGFHHKNGV